MQFNKKKILILTSVVLLFVISYSSITLLMSIPKELVHVYYQESCSNTEAWAAHMDQAGFKTKLHKVDNVTEMKDKYHVPLELRGCHTAIYDGFVIEGHVPAQSLTHFYNAEIAKKSGLLGLAVKGYPAGGAGLEGGYPEVYDVYVFDKEGNVSVYEKFNQNFHD